MRNKRGIISIKMESKKLKKLKIISSFFKSVDENLCKSDASSITQNPEEEIVRRCTETLAEKPNQPGISFIYLFYFYLFKTYLHRVTTFNLIQ